MEEYAKYCIAEDKESLSVPVIRRNESELLDKFAGMAMQKIIEQGYIDLNSKDIAMESFNIAEAMIKEREKRINK
jgi:hypothetical protein